MSKNKTDLIQQTHIIHVIGAVGAGKSKFRRSYLQDVPTFDIQEIYSKEGFTPQDLQDPKIYQQFIQALEDFCFRFIENAQNQNSPVICFESSGLNRALNRILIPYSPFTIWIQPDIIQITDPDFLIARPYAEELNKLVLKTYKAHQFPIDVEFDRSHYAFSSPIPIWLNTIIHKRTSPNKKPNPELSVVEEKLRVDLFKVGKRFKCPKCNAEFSKGEYLEMHFKRFPSCIPN